MHNGKRVSPTKTKKRQESWKRGAREREEIREKRRTSAPCTEIKKEEPNEQGGGRNWPQKKITSKGS